MNKLFLILSFIIFGCREPNKYIEKSWITCTVNDTIVYDNPGLRAEILEHGMVLQIRKQFSYYEIYRLQSSDQVSCKEFIKKVLRVELNDKN